MGKFREPPIPRQNVTGATYEGGHDPRFRKGSGVVMGAKLPPPANQDPNTSGRWVTINGKHVHIGGKGGIDTHHTPSNIVGPDKPLRQKIEDFVRKQYPAHRVDAIVAELSQAFSSGHMTEYHRRAWKSITGKDAPKGPKWPGFGQDWR